MNIIQNFKNIKEELSSVNYNPKIIAVSKTFPLEHIQPLLDFGHRVFGENKVQEAQKKWESPRKKFNDLELHLIGALQRNKAKDAIKTFDYIHSLDSEKLALALIQAEQKLNIKRKYFVQINTGNDKQKSGIIKEELPNFIKFIEGKLNIIGLMCIPPVDENPEIHFKLLEFLAKQNNLQNLSMGMTVDYMLACKNGSNHIRVGSKIFGIRK